MQRTKSGEFNWVDLSTKDFEGQSAFYAGLFGWTYEDMPYGDGQTYRMFNKDGHSVAGMSQLPPEVLASGAPTMWNTYLATDDLDAIVAKAEGLGATVVFPPGDVPGTGRIAAIQDPTGGFVWFWVPNAPDATMEYLMPGMLSWNDLATREPEKAIDFYTKLLGWEIAPQDNQTKQYWQINVDGVGEGGIMPMPEMVPEQVRAFWTPYFGTVDINASVAKVAELGGSVQAPPVQVDDMLIFAVVADPAGAAFCLLQPLGPTAWPAS
jgi:predicted enzyme related to lactoylglutathione lyase